MCKSVDNFHLVKGFSAGQGKATASKEFEGPRRRLIGPKRELREPHRNQGGLKREVNIMKERGVLEKKWKFSLVLINLILYASLYFS